MRKDHRDRRYAGENYLKTYRDESGRQLSTREHSLWSKMVSRVKSDAVHKWDPSYRGCKLNKDFECYKYFTDWCQEQKGFRKEGWILDKDIVCSLEGKKTKEYSPETCVFVPILINSFLTFSKRKNISGYAGVSWQKTYTKSKGKFIVSCAELNGKNKTLGRTDTAEEGYKLYRKHKVKLAKVLADTYREDVDPRVTYYLDNFDKYIDDLAVFNKTETGEN